MKLPSFLRFRPIAGELKAAPLFIDTAINILASLFVFVWGLLFLSNPLYQYAAYTRARNALLTERNAERFLKDIVCIGVDQEARLAGLPVGRDADGKPVAPPSDTLSVTVGLIGEALAAVGEYAATRPGQRVVVGVDYPFALAERDTWLLDEFLSAVERLPPNVFVVAGSMIAKRPDSLTTLRSSQLFNALMNRHPDAMERLFLGHIHRMDATMRSGNDADGGSQIAVGYAPIFGSGSRKAFYSLPLAMYVVGEIMEENPEGGWNFATDFYEGFSGYVPSAAAAEAAAAAGTEVDDVIARKLLERIGRSPASLYSLTYYNFFSRSDIRDDRFKPHYLWLSTVRKPLDPGDPFGGVANGYGDIANWEKTALGSESKPGPVRYFFVAPDLMPEYLLGEGERNDTMASPAAPENSFTYQREASLGVMGHVVALSNLRNRFFMDRMPDWIAALVSAVAFAAAALVSWRKSVAKSLFFAALCVAGMMVLSFALFCLGIFLAVRAMVAATLLGFSLTALVRFIYTMTRNDILETASTRFFGWDKLAALKSIPEWHKPAMKRGLVIMAVVLKRTPRSGDEEFDEVFHAEVREDMTAAVFDEVERRNGMHVLGPTDDIMGVWNYPEAEAGSADAALDCAEAILSRVAELQAKADRLSRGKTGYRVFLDACLHVCDGWAGFSVRNDAASFTVSGTGVSLAASYALSRSYDRQSSLALSLDFKAALAAAPEPGPDGDWHETKFGRTVFLSKDLPDERQRTRSGRTSASDKGVEE